MIMPIDSKSLEIISAVDMLCILHAELLLPDVYTHIHEVMTTPLLPALGAKLGLEPPECLILWYCAKLHDAGKLGVLPELFASRNLRLTADDRLMIRIQLHAAMGRRFFESANTYFAQDQIRKNQPTIFTYLADAAGWHHRWYDGNGYPDGPSGNDIPIIVAIVSVVDALSAMIGPDRPWRAAMNFSDALAEIKLKSGTQFNPLVVAALLDLCDQPSMHALYAH